MEIEPTYTKDDLQTCEISEGFLSQYISVQRQVGIRARKDHQSFGAY